MQQLSFVFYTVCFIDCAFHMVLILRPTKPSLHPKPRSPRHCVILRPELISALAVTQVYSCPRRNPTTNLAANPVDILRPDHQLLSLPMPQPLSQLLPHPLPYTPRRHTLRPLPWGLEQIIDEESPLNRDEGIRNRTRFLHTPQLPERDRDRDID